MQPTTQQSIKRIFDILLAIAGMIVLLPVILFTAILVMLSSRGPVFFSQERVGLNQKPFMIWKFRSMYVTAEETGPQLSSDEDSRVTAWGRIMRKWRLDELPQLWNVIKGDMSIVGPRPERKYFIDRIIITHPEYLKLLQVKPGLTSMGMVRFGYAENVEEMIERMQYDLAYVERPSLKLDITIMLQSIKVVFAGKGK
jgi:lipopolysaccharide/colanic/teichoic acid biosynthesis glycosyltransferase